MGRLVSEDGGKSFRTVLTSKGALLGFALSGPLVCPESSTTTRECPKDWPETRRLLGAPKETPDARPVAEPVATKVGLEARPQGSGRLFIIAIAAVAAISIAVLGLRRVWRKR